VRDAACGSSTSRAIATVTSPLTRAGGGTVDAPPVIMSTPRYRIVVGLDASEYAEIVLEHALDQAACRDAPDIHFVTAVADGADIDDVKRRMAALVLPALDGFDCTDWHVRLHVRIGKPAEEVTDLAAELRAHLLVVGRFGVLHPHRRIGTVAAEIVDRSPCVVHVVGLVDQSPDRVPQCPDCVAVRAESDGMRWFCEAHGSADLRLSTLVTGSSWLGGSLMW
jgi:nucleotide-binding universal stress UspA family protein